MLLRVARGECSRRAVGSTIGGKDLDDLAHQAAADAVVSIVGKVASFRGDSRFTTWAYKFAVLEVSSKLGRRYLRANRVSMDAEDWEQLPDRFGVGPDEMSESRELLGALHAAVDSELTAHQRTVFVAIVLNAVPLDALALSMDTNRNAIYKTLFDARRKLRKHLTVNGYLDPVEGGTP
jgi:RNA polymerase sigma-70 factor (ECF subfamily)